MGAADHMFSDDLRENFALDHGDARAHRFFQHAITSTAPREEVNARRAGAGPGMRSRASGELE